MRPWCLVESLLCVFLAATTSGCSALLGDFSAGEGALGDSGSPADASLPRDAGGADGTIGDGSASGPGDGTVSTPPIDARADGGGGTPTDGPSADRVDTSPADALSDGPAADGSGSPPDDAGPCNASTVGASCSMPTCSSGMATAAGTCLASGACQIPSSTLCSPYVCGVTACKQPCAVDSDCVPGYLCTSASCVAPKSQGGSPCTRDVECQAGLYCSPEGICCNAPCSGACQVCNSAGMCVNVPANQQPRPGHPTCTNGGSSPCGGYCDGVDSGCFYPTTACRTASCGCFPANGCTASATENCANGTCPDPVYTSCNGFACDSSGIACGETCDPIADTGCYGFNCCHTVFTGICLHSCTSTCPSSGTCQ